MIFRKKKKRGWGVQVPITEQIDEMVGSVLGWTPADQLFALFNLVFASKDLPGDLVEIGCWAGRSTAVLGLAARLIGDTHLYCIDLFPGKDDWWVNDDGSYSFAVTVRGVLYKAYQDQRVWAEPFERDILPLYAKYPNILEAFQETLEKYNLRDLVTTHVGDSSSFLQEAPKGLQCKLAFIDGDHCYAAVCQDIAIIERILVPGGWICFDDAFTGYDGVNRAINDRIINNPQYDLCHQLTRKLFVARRQVR
jgi:predicted O-methyltransferase YrrM